MMDKLNKLAMPDVKSGTPQEKLNAVNRMLKSIEMMTEAYNQIVPVINAKIDWLDEVEKVIKDDTQDKKIDELIAINKILLGRVAKIESESDYEYDDSHITRQIGEVSKRQDDLARAQNALEKAVRAIGIPKVPSIEPLRKRVKMLENAPKYVYDDSEIAKRIDALESKPGYKYDDKALKMRVSALESKIKNLMGQ